jgi:hypothetical protein
MSALAFNQAAQGALPRQTRMGALERRCSNLNKRKASGIDA